MRNSEELGVRSGGRGASNLYSTPIPLFILVSRETFSQKFLLPHIDNRSVETDGICGYIVAGH